MALPPRATRFTFLGGDLDGLAREAVDQGFSVSPTEDADGLVLITSDIVDELRFPDFDDLMHGWAHQFASEYQGWGAV